MLSDHYKKLLSRGGANSMNESAGAARVDLSESGINERLKETKKQLDEIILNYLDDQPHLYEIADEIIKQGVPALRMIGESQEAAIKSKKVTRMLEAVVRTDGSRPSFMVRNGVADLKSSPVGSWEGELVSSQNKLQNIFQRVGRIDDPNLDQGFAGTGFLVSEDHILTNLHVLQLIAEKNSAGKWVIDKDIYIDFGHEYRAVRSQNPRKLSSVVFAGADPIEDSGPIDHNKLDLALIRLEPGNSPQPEAKFYIDLDPDWAEQGQHIYTIGYPGRPPAGNDPNSLLETLFQSTYGHKRIAPGEVVNAQRGLPPWTVCHDATTLGGNSGSLIIISGREDCAVGIHYGGRSTQTRVNWGHILGSEKIMKTVNPGRTEELKKIFQNAGVEFKDRTLSNG